MIESEYNDRLNTLYTYTRVSDGKVFKIKFYSHWTDIVAEDGETDSVKLGWPENGYDLMVSASKGHSYHRTRNQCS